MLNLIFGIEDSFTKSLIYDVLLASVIIISGSAVYLALVGSAMYLNKIASDHSVASLKSDEQN